MTAPSPLIVDGTNGQPTPRLVPVRLFAQRTRACRALFVWEQEVWLRTRRGWIRWPRGYVTDFGSIPALAEWLSLGTIKPLGDHVWAAGGHDWGYAAAEPGERAHIDRDFNWRMKVDDTNPIKRALMYRSVQLGGGKPYSRSAGWWETENFADPDTGEYPVAPPFARQEAFVGGLWGLRERPDWNY